jgi:short-subunit dehydrogenase
MTSLPKGTEARSYVFDIASRQAVFDHADEVKRDFGTAHFVINNAGATVVGTVAHLSIEEIEWQLGINLWGVIYGTKAFLPMMLAQREGCIVNVSSVFGLVGFPTQGAYNISKFGVRGLTECLWSELEGTGVRAVCVHPGGIATNIDRAGRRCAAYGPEEELAQAGVKKMLVTPPEECAADIIAGLERGRRRILTGSKSTTLHWLSRLLPNRYPGIVRALAK